MGALGLSWKNGLKGRPEKAASFVMEEIVPLQDVMARGTVSAADGQRKMRVLQCKFLAGETRDGLEHFEPYGLTSEPLKDGMPEALALFFDGDRSHGVVVCVADRRYRLKVEPGEVAIYDDIGQKVHLTRSGIEVFTPKNLAASIGGSASVTVSGSTTLTCPTVTIDSQTVHLTGSLTVDGAIVGTGGLTVSGGSGASVTGSITVSDDVTAGGISLMTHTHGCPQGGDTTPPK